MNFRAISVWQFICNTSKCYSSVRTKIQRQLLKVRMGQHLRHGFPRTGKTLVHSLTRIPTSREWRLQAKVPNLERSSVRIWQDNRAYLSSFSTRGWEVTPTPIALPCSQRTELSRFANRRHGNIAYARLSPIKIPFRFGNCFWLSCAFVNQLNRSSCGCNDAMTWGRTFCSQDGSSWRTWPWIFQMSSTTRYFRKLKTIWAMFQHRLPISMNLLCLKQIARMRICRLMVDFHPGQPRLIREQLTISARVAVGPERQYTSNDHQTQSVWRSNRSCARHEQGSKPIFRRWPWINW